MNAKNQRLLQDFHQMSKALRLKAIEAKRVHDTLTNTLTAASLNSGAQTHIAIWHSHVPYPVETSRFIKLSLHTHRPFNTTAYFLDVQDEGVINIMALDMHSKPILTVPFTKSPDKTVANTLLALRRINPRLNKHFKSAQTNALDIA